MTNSAAREFNNPKSNEEGGAPNREIGLSLLHLYQRVNLLFGNTLIEVIRSGKRDFAGSVV